MIHYKVVKTDEGNILRVIYPLDISRIDNLAKKNKAIGGDYFYDPKGNAIGRDYFVYVKGSYGILIKAVPDSFVKDLRNLSYIKQAGVIDTIKEFLKGSKFVRLEKAAQNIKPLNLKPNEYEYNFIAAKNLYSEIEEYKREYLDTLLGKIFQWRVDIPADLKFTDALLYLQKKVQKKDVIHEEDAWGLGKPLRPLLFWLKSIKLETFIVRIEKLERDIYKKINYLGVVTGLLEYQKYLEKISKEFLKGIHEDKKSLGLFDKPKSFLRDEEDRRNITNPIQYSKKIMQVRKKINRNIDPLITVERLGVTLSRIAQQRRDQLINKYQVY